MINNKKDIVFTFDNNDMDLNVNDKYSNIPFYFLVEQKGIIETILHNQYVPEIVLKKSLDFLNRISYLNRDKNYNYNFIENQKYIIKIFLEGNYFEDILEKQLDLLSFIIENVLSNKKLYKI